MPILLAAVIAAATAQSAPPPVDPAALQAATALVQQLDVKGAVLRNLQRNVAGMRAGLALRNMLAAQPGFVPAYNANKAKFDAALTKAGAIQADIAEKIIRDNSGSIAPGAATAYARNFTAAEIKGLSEFYKTPLGAKLRERSNRVDGEILAFAGQAIGGKIDAAMQAAAPRLQAALAPLNSGPPPAAPLKK